MRRDKFLVVIFAIAAACRSPQTRAPSTSGDAHVAHAAVRAPVATSYADGVTVRLTPIFPGAQRASFGVPLARGKVADVATVAVTIAGQPVAADLSESLPDLDFKGARVGARAIRVQLDAALIDPKGTDVELRWQGAPRPAPNAPSKTLFASPNLSIDSPVIVPTAVRTITKSGDTYALVETSRADKTLFVGREPRIIAAYPEGYLAQTGILGPLVTAATVKSSPNLAGLQFLSAANESYTRSAMFDEPYALNPDPESVPDFSKEYEAWLYDRCATFLIAYAHVGDAKFLRHALQSCSFYSSKISLRGADRGIFTGKGDPDIKYSHMRGLYAYYALTGDEGALAAMQAIAEMWLNDRTFVKPYREGHLRGSDKLWTERLLGTSMEGLLYGYRVTSDAKYLNAFKEILATAYAHITGDAAALATINPDAKFPPQNCWIHSASQHSEGNADEPWCSSWMSELTLDALYQYWEHTADPRVGEIFVRLSRFLRDVGSGYFYKNPIGDSFLAPTKCFDPDNTENPRILTPLYGAGTNASGARVSSGEYGDYEHCTDASVLVAAARWALEKGTPAKPAPKPFADEKASFSTLHQEFLFCANSTFRDDHRPHRSPLSWKSSQLADGAANPTKFIIDQKIGYPQNNNSPLRKISWWFNMSMMQFGLLQSAGIAVKSVTPGQLHPASCK